MTAKKIISLNLILCITIISYAHTPVQSTRDNIDSLFTSLAKSKKFNGVVIVSHKGNLVYHNSFGYAGPNKRLTKDYQFNIGSIYKELPAIAIMQMQEKGELKIDDKLSKHLPELPTWAEKITLENLLQYTSGLPRINWGQHKIINDKVLMEDLQNLDTLVYEPSTNYIYTNYSPFLLAKVVETKSGQSFTSFVETHITIPLDMKQSSFSDSFPYKEKAFKAIPVNEELVEDQLPFSIESKLFLFTTTAEDLLKFSNGLHSNELINKNSLKIISKTSSPEEDGLQSPLGNVVINNGEVTYHAHHGSSGNFEALMSIYKEDGISIILLTNRKNGNLYEITSSVRKILKE